MKKVHALQDAIHVSQKADGKFETPNWDQASQKTVRDALLALGSTIPDFNRAFGIEMPGRSDVSIVWPSQGRNDAIDVTPGRVLVPSWGTTCVPVHYQSSR